MLFFILILIIAAAAALARQIRIVPHQMTYVIERECMEDNGRLKNC